MGLGDQRVNKLTSDSTTSTIATGLLHKFFINMIISWCHRLNGESLARWHYIYIYRFIHIDYILINTHTYIYTNMMHSCKNANKYIYIRTNKLLATIRSWFGNRSNIKRFEHHWVLQPLRPKSIQAPKTSSIGHDLYVPWRKIKFLKQYPPKNGHITKSWKRTIEKRKIIFQAAIFRGYVNFHGSNFSWTKCVF